MHLLKPVPSQAPITKICHQRFIIDAPLPQCSTDLNKTCIAGHQCRPNFFNTYTLVRLLHDLQEIEYVFYMPHVHLMYLDAPVCVGCVFPPPTG